MDGAVMMRLEVRALTGESVAVSIPADRTVRDLNNLLKKTFPLTAKYPNFILYHKGTKLSLQNQISSYCIEAGEVIGLIPVVKKQNTQAQESCEKANSSNATDVDQAPVNKFADLAWNHMVHELRERSGGDGETTTTLHNSSSNVGLKRKRGSDSDTVGNSDCLVLSILEHSIEKVLDEENAEKFVKVLGKKNCLEDASPQNCLFNRILQSHDGCIGAGGSAECSCPAWLKIALKTFTFLNIYSACLHLRQEMITLNRLAAALDWLDGLGIHHSMKVIEDMSLLFPKVIYFVDFHAKGKRCDEAIAIVRPAEDEHLVEVTPAAISPDGKQASLPKLFYAMERREIAFRVTISSLVRKISSDVTKFNSVEDLVNFLREKDTPASNVKNSGPARTKTSVQLPNRGKAATISKKKVNNLCHDTNALLPEEMVEHLKKGLGSLGQMVHIQKIGRRSPIFVEIPDKISEFTKQTLQKIGVTKLYSHQAESVQASLAKKNVVVATMTSSGKSLCYNLPVLDELFKDPSACALYMFPTKALCQDQLRALKYMTKNSNVLSCIGIYDGDTLLEERTWLRKNARLLITNPDMLHKTILPNHGKFARILSNLRFVVIDESHTYKGAFGCHTALILRRLHRLCSHVYGSDPKLILSTATSANPQQHSMDLANLSTLELIQKDGSPASQKLFVLWNPSLQQNTVEDQSEEEVAASKSSDRSPTWEISCLFAEMVQHGLRCITFCPSRKLCELVLLYTQEILHETAPHLVNSITSYRGGYTPEP